MRHAAAALVLLALLQEKPFRLKGTDLKQQVIWGASAEGSGGLSLAFGGQDQKADDGNPHTRIQEGGAWKAVHAELRAKNRFQKLHGELWDLRTRVKDFAARARFQYLDGQDGEGLEAACRDLLEDLEPLLRAPSAVPPGEDAHAASLKERLESALARALEQGRPVPDLLRGGPGPEAIRRLDSLRIALEQASEIADAEPAPRALSPIAFDAKSGLFILFGGDHLDYLVNDTWVFSPAERRWLLRRPPSAPSPRAGHELAATGDGKVVLRGGYAYTSTTDYVGGPYRNHADGEWTYDVAADAWTGSGPPAPPDARAYRTGRLHPDHCLEGPKPDRAAFAAWLSALPSNTWVATKPPQLPAMNRDWGTAVLDPDRDLLLRWSGGHSAHGGTDVLQYHLLTNRWELPIPVELPLGQTYSNTEYPEGVNFNRRPWVTGHTYQSYGYDARLRKMLFTGRRDLCHVYDPDRGDWAGFFAKPKGMAYGDCFYTLTLCPTPRGLVCWTQSGALYRFEAPNLEWVQRPLEGKLPGSVVDNSTLAWDARRGRLLFWRKLYGDKESYDGEIRSVELGSGAVRVLSPAGREAAAAVPYLCQIRYDEANDLFLVGGTLPPDPDGFRRTPAYDPTGNRWISLRIAGEDPSGPRGRNVSLGLVYDAERRLFWAVDTNSRVFVLRLDPSAADLRPM